MHAGKGATFSAGRFWLSQCSLPWLLVLDNADDPDMDISDYFPAGSIGHILITTRNPSVTVNASAASLKFSGLEPEEAISLLLKSAYPYNHQNESDAQKRSLARSIAVTLGYLAIAVDQAGATIRRKICSLEEYLQVYIGCQHHLLSSPTSIPSGEDKIITTWEIPFKRIETRHSVEHGDAVTLMHIFPFLHFEAITERIFYVAWMSSETLSAFEVTGPELLRLDSSRFGEAQTRLRQAIGILYDYSILDHDAERATCSLHPVVHKWARTRLSNEGGQAHWLDRTIALLARCISPYLEASGRMFRSSLLPHLDSCMQILRIYEPSFPRTKQRANEIEKFTWVYAENGLWTRALSLQHKIIQYRKREFGNAHNDTLKAKRSLSNFYWNLFDIKSALAVQHEILKERWWSRPSLKYWLSPLKPDHIAYCIALDDLTQTLWLAGQRDLSKRTGERAMNGLLKRLGPEDPQTLNAMFNLARTYMHLGELEKCHRLLVSVLSKRKKLFGLKHPDTLMVRNELGMCFWARKLNLAIAESLVANVLQTRKEILGEEHAYTMWSVNDLSKVFCERDRPLDAAVLLEKLVPVVERTLGDEHVGMNMTKGNLARAYILCGRCADAEVLFGQMLSVLRDDHPDWVFTMSGLVHVQIRLGRFDEAERNCNTILEHIAHTRLLAAHNPQTLAVVEQLANIYLKTGRSGQISSLRTTYPAMDETKIDRRFSMLPAPRTTRRRTG